MTTTHSALRRTTIALVFCILATVAISLIDFPGMPIATVRMLAEETPAKVETPKVQKAASPSQIVSSGGGWGTFTGQILFAGELPVLQPIYATGAERKDPQNCMGEIPDERLIVDPKSRGIRDVFVYLIKAEVIHPELKKSSKAEVEIRAENCRFVPHTLIARTDQVVVFDGISGNKHSLHEYPMRNPSYGKAHPTALNTFRWWISC